MTVDLDELERLVHSYDDTLDMLIRRPGDVRLTLLRNRQEGSLANCARPLAMELRAARERIAELERTETFGAEVTGGRTEGEP
jgi:hypothetical protein